ncbi:MAG: TadE family protein [Ilumatobacteraceae bacterium]
MRRRRAKSSAGAGSVTVELVVLAPVLIMLTMFVVFLGRAGGSVQQVRHAADTGARAASLVSPATMRGVASAAAARDLADNGVNCSSTTIAVSVDDAPGASSVTVTVSCVVNLDGTSLVGVDGRTVTARSTEVIDRYRGS